MKNLFKINKVLVIINIILFIIPYFGLLFLMVLGASQVIMSFVIGYNLKQLNKKTELLFTIYSLTAVFILLNFFFMNLGFTPNNAPNIVISMILSVVMAFLHLKITHMIYKNQPIKTFVI